MENRKNNFWGCKGVLCHKKVESTLERPLEDFFMHWCINNCKIWPQQRSFPNFLYYFTVMFSVSHVVTRLKRPSRANWLNRYLYSDQAEVCCKLGKPRGSKSFWGVYGSLVKCEYVLNWSPGFVALHSYLLTTYEAAVYKFWDLKMDQSKKVKEDIEE